MKIGIQTWGSNGDIRPMLALANGLQKAKHSVTLSVSSIDNKSYREQCADFNITYRQIPEHVDFDMEDFAQRSFKMNPLQWLTALIDEVFLPYEDIIYQTAQELAETHDVIIGHHFLYPLKIAAAKTQTPHVSVTLCPVAIASAAYAPFRFPDLGSVVNRWQWRLFDNIFDWLLKNRLGKLWRTEGMPPIHHVLPDLLTSDRLNLVAVDPLFCHGQSHWPALHQVTGFLNLEENVWTLPVPLQDFLSAGEAPVYMTFGSLQQAVPEWSMDLFINAARQTGCRAIIQTSSARYPANSHKDNLYFIGKHPHTTLFRHCAAVLHHGGAGTSQTATMAGLPSVVAPFMDEQLYWAQQLQHLGLAPAPLPAKRLNVQKLATQLQRVLTDDNMYERARQAGAKLQQTDGVHNAVNLIEGIMKKPS